jgi:hypothetical protein
VEVAKLPWRRPFDILSKHKGYVLIMEDYQCDARLEMWAGGTQVLAYATEALILAGRWSDAQKQVDEALSLAYRIGERIFVPDLLLQARVALALDQPGRCASRSDSRLAGKGTCHAGPLARIGGARGFVRDERCRHRGLQGIKRPAAV